VPFSEFETINLHYGSLVLLARKLLCGGALFK